MVEIVTESGLIDEILGSHQKGLGVGYLGYRSHCFRMLNVGRFLVPDEPHRDDRFAIMAAFHDLPFFLDGNLDYLGRASDWARDYLEAMGREEWEPEMRATFPLNEAYKGVAMPAIARYAFSHISRPLPMMRW